MFTGKVISFRRQASARATFKAEFIFLNANLMVRLSGDANLWLKLPRRIMPDC
jgi:hypothetical protein